MKYLILKNQFLRTLYSPTDTDWWLFSSFPPLNFTYIEFFLLTFVVQSFSCDLVATLKVLTWLDSGFRKMLMRVESCWHLLNLSLNLTFKCLLYFLSFPLFLILSVSNTILLWFVSLFIFHIPPLSAPEINYESVFSIYFLFWHFLVLQSLFFNLKPHPAAFWSHFFFCTFILTFIFVYF